ncbi:acyltransferase family protein [Telluria beijingensis]|uniref:acyltransferase family protein n=1 Tax=Telluria beijingensis TaxID=3068633 RepID=UPI0027961A1D|nr:acyltransferase [Massilia sp. REN29]
MTTHYIPYLDGWRGLAILLLLVGHFFPVDGINFGIVGVALFFALSGYLMTWALFVKGMHIGVFYRRRISRVMPSIAVYLALITGFFFLTGQQIVLGELLPALTFTNNYFVTGNWTMPFGHIWSLSVEEHAYVVLALAACWCRWRGTAATRAIALIVCVILLAIAIYAFVPGAQAPGASLRTEQASFGIFMAGLVLLASGNGGLRGAAAWIAPVALLLGIAAHWWSVPASVRIVVSGVAFALAINTMHAAPAWLRSVFEWSWLRKLGQYSFSIYLWQQPMYQLCRDIDLAPALGVAVALLSGLVAFHLVERPLRSWLNSGWAAESGTPAVAGVASNDVRPHSIS